MLNVCQKLNIPELYCKNDKEINLLDIFNPDSKSNYLNDMRDSSSRRTNRNFVNPMDLLPQDCCCPSRNRNRGEILPSDVQINNSNNRSNFCKGLSFGILLSTIIFLLINNIEEIKEISCSYLEKFCPEIQHSDTDCVELKKLQKEMNQLKDELKALSNETQQLWEEMKKEPVKVDTPVISGEYGKYNIEKLIDNALSIYDADKIGIYDYAAGYAGGTVVSTPQTSTYPTNRTYEMFGIFEVSILSKPDVILDANTQPGECFAFVGDEAKIIIKLGRKVVITDVTLEYGSVTLLENQNSAPKDFKVLGCEDSNGIECELLGQFQYQINEKPIQTFHIEKVSPKKYEYVLLQILSNHGNPEFTCIYRFRVHSVEKGLAVGIN